MMNSPWFYLLLGLFIILVPAHNSHAQTRELSIEHEKYEFNAESRVYTYTKPRALIGDVTVSSRTMVYRESEGKFYFSGNVFVRSPGAILTADEAVFDRASAEAVLDNATLYDEVNDVFIESEQIKKVGENEYVIVKGTLTKCDMDKKAWELAGSTIVYKVEEYAYILNTALFFYDVPLFYSPYLSWPTRSERATGFLMPEFESSTTSDTSMRYGGRIKIPYFITFDQEHDLTVKADLLQYRGLGWDLEYLYAFQPGMSGRFRLWYLNETITDRDITSSYETLGKLDPSSDSFDLRPIRYAYSFDHKQNIIGNGQLFFHQHQNSDNEVNREYFDAEIDIDSHFLQTFDLVFPWSGGSLAMSYATEEDFIYQSVYDTTTDALTHLNTHPSITVNQKLSNLFDTPVSVRFSGNLTKYDRTHGWNADAKKASMQVSAPFSFDFLNVIPSTSRGFYQYNASYTPAAGASGRDPDDFGWTIDTHQLELNLEAYRLFYNGKNAATNKLSIIPRIRFVEVENVNQAGVVNYAFEDPVYSQKTISYILETNFLSKNLSSNAIRTTASLSLEQIINLNWLETNTIYHQPGYLEGSAEHPGLPLRVRFTLTPSDAFTTSLFYRYDSVERTIVETQVSVSASSSDGHTFSVAYVDNSELYYTPDNVYNPVARTLTVAHHHKLNDIMDLNISATWDRSRNIYISDKNLNRQLTDAKVELLLHHNCYYLSTGYMESITDEVLDKKFWIAVQFPLTLPGFGDTTLVEPLKQFFTIPNEQ